jgi:hypothetical protein
MEKAVRHILNEPAVVKNLRDSQQMTLVLGGAKEFEAFFVQQVKFWGQVVRDNNIRA